MPDFGNFLIQLEQFEIDCKAKRLWAGSNQNRAKISMSGHIFLVAGEVTYIGIPTRDVEKSNVQMTGSYIEGRYRQGAAFTYRPPINFLAFPRLHQSLFLTVSMSAGGLLQTWDTAAVHYLRTPETWVIIRNEVVHGGLTEDLRG